MLKCVLFLVFFGVTFSQVIDYNDCPYVEVVENFNLTDYLGTWYLTSLYWDYFKIGTKCNSATYTLRPNGSIDVLDENVYIATETPQRKTGIANLEGNGTEGILYFSYPPTKGVVGEYLILDTDYQSWSVVWSCIGRDTVGSIRNAWVYSREINPSEEVVNATLSVFNKYQIPTDELLMNESQENCPIKM